LSENESRDLCLHKPPLHEMAILEGGDQDLLRLWNLVAELSEEINRNRTLAVSLYTQASNVKVCLANVVGSWLLLTRGVESGYPFSDGVCAASVSLVSSRDTP
jgi:hypothetical protein